MEKHVKDSFMTPPNGNAELDPDIIEQYEEEKQWEVLDINFITSDWTELDMLTEMDVLDRDKKVRIYALQKAEAANAAAAEGKEETAAE